MKLGFAGSEEQWLASLQGREGEKGDPGKDGKDGKDGGGEAIPYSDLLLLINGLFETTGG